MEKNAEKLIAKVKTTLTKRTVDSLGPADKPYIAWDDRLSGFGVRVQPSGTKTFVVNYRADDGGRRAPNKRVTLGRYGRIVPRPGKAHGAGTSGPRRRGRRSGGGARPSARNADPRRGIRGLHGGQPHAQAKDIETYRRNLRVCFSDWLSPLHVERDRHLTGLHRYHADI